MFKVLKSGFIRNPVLEMKIEEPTDDIVLFGNTYRMYADVWKKHVHLKCTNACDAECGFCIERQCSGDPENPDAFMESMRLLVGQMKDQGMFSTLSVTGGEPTLFPMIQDVIDFATEVKPYLFSINSNGSKMLSLRRSSLHGWLNLSKHCMVDRKVFNRTWSVRKSDMHRFKMEQPDAKLRLQCVLGVDGGVGSVREIETFVDYYKDVADDFSFRSLIVETENGKMSPLFKEFRDFLFDEGCMVEQAIQDYYVYETYVRGGIPITISWANMFLLKRYNETHKGNFLEEIIVHPDGMITGSWDKKTLVIRKGEK